MLTKKMLGPIQPFTLLLFLMPLVLSYFLGSFLEKQQQELVIPIAIVDEDHSEFSIEFIRQMSAEERIVVHEVTIDRAEQMLSRNEVDSVFVIQKQFQTKLLAEERAGLIELWISPLSAASGIVQELAASKVVKISSAVKASNMVTNLYKQKRIEQEGLWQEAYRYYMKQWEPEPLMKIHYIEELPAFEGKKAQAEGSAFVPYLGIWSCFTMMAVWISFDWIVKERTAVFARMKTTYKGLAHYLSTKSFLLFLFHSAQTTLSFFIFSHKQWIGGDLERLLGMLVFLFFTVMLGVWLASFFQHLGSYYIAVLLGAFLLSFIGGSFFSLSEVIPAADVVSFLLPQQSLISSVSDGGWYNRLMMLGISLLFWRWALWRLKSR